MDVWMDGRMSGWMSGRMDGWIGIPTLNLRECFNRRYFTLRIQPPPPIHSVCQASVMGAHPPRHSSLIPRSPSMHFHSHNQRTEHRSTYSPPWIVGDAAAESIILGLPGASPTPNPGPWALGPTFCLLGQSTECGKVGNQVPIRRRVDQNTKLWSVDTVEYYAAMKKVDRSPLETAQSTLEGMTLSEISPSEKDTYPMISLLRGVLSNNKLLKCVYPLYR